MRGRRSVKENAGADHCIAEFRSKILKTSGVNAGAAARVP